MTYFDTWKDLLSSPYIIDNQMVKNHIAQQRILDDILPTTDHFYIVVNLVSPGYEFISKNQELVTGWPNAEFLEKGVERFIELIHPEDVELVVKGFYADLRKCFDAVPLERKKFCQFQYNFRLRHRHGHYIHLLEQGNIIELDHEGNLLIALDHISVLEPDVIPCVKGTIRLLGEEKTYKTIFNKTYGPGIGTERITNREHDIIRCLLHGYSSKEIANILSISHHTVDTHRRKILHKLKLKTTKSLMDYAIRNLTF
jgi:DNA-binding CsgD family transcriptional regulator